MKTENIAPTIIRLFNINYFFSLMQEFDEIILLKWKSEIKYQILCV